MQCFINIFAFYKWTKIETNKIYGIKFLIPDLQYTDNHIKETSNMKNLTGLEIKTTIAQMQCNL